MRGAAHQVVDRSWKNGAGPPCHRRLSRAFSAQRALAACRGTNEALPMTLAAYRALGCCVAFALLACGETLDAGTDQELPVNAQNPVILSNDGVYDNWQGEYAMLLTRGGGSALAGIVVSTGGLWNDIDANFSGWQELVSRAGE